MFFTQILKDNDAYYALHNTYFHSVFYIKKKFSHLFQIGKDIFHLQFTKQKRLLDTYQEIDRKTFFFFVQNHIVFATKLHFNSFIDYNRFQQMFYMIITANICISK